jgi:hypothetical protein
MLRRSLSRVRASLAFGLMVAATSHAAFAYSEPADPPPAAPEANTESVTILDAQKRGLIEIDARGAGDERVRIAVRNRSDRRLHVIIPPGMVASSATAQAAGGGAGGAGGAGGFQSMGLGSISNNLGAFGRFVDSSTAEAGFKSLPVKGDDADPAAIDVPVEQTVKMILPAVCLNYGLPTPNGSNRFRLVDVDDYTPDVRARTALRTLATMGTSVGVAQAVAWHTFNGMTFEQLAALADGKPINSYELALAARFVQTIDQTANVAAFDPSFITRSRVFVQLTGRSVAERSIQAIARDLDGKTILGLPVTVVDPSVAPPAHGPALLLTIELIQGENKLIAGKGTMRNLTLDGVWNLFGRFGWKDVNTLESFNADKLAGAVDRAVASAFVAAKPSKRSQTSTTLRIENRLPFTLAGIVVRTGDSAGDPKISFEGVGIGPGRATPITIEAAGGKVDRVILNGL